MNKKKYSLSLLLSFASLQPSLAAGDLLSELICDAHSPPFEPLRVVQSLETQDLFSRFAIQEATVNFLQGIKYQIEEEIQLRRAIQESLLPGQNGFNARMNVDDPILALAMQETQSDNVLEAIDMQQALFNDIQTQQAYMEKLLAPAVDEEVRAVQENDLLVRPESSQHSARDPIDLINDAIADLDEIIFYPLPFVYRFNVDSSEKGDEGTKEVSGESGTSTESFFDELLRKEGEEESDIPQASHTSTLPESLQQNIHDSDRKIEEALSHLETMPEPIHLVDQLVDTLVQSNISPAPPPPPPMPLSFGLTPSPQKRVAAEPSVPDQEPVKKEGLIEQIRKGVSLKHIEESDKNVTRKATLAKRPSQEDLKQQINRLRKTNPNSNEEGIEGGTVVTNQNKKILTDVLDNIYESAFKRIRGRRLSILGRNELK